MAHPTAFAFGPSRCAARTALGATVLALLALSALHVLRSDLDPSWHMLSEYALGAHGWLMALCFAAFAAGSAGLGAALLAHAATRMGRIGVAFLLATAVGLGLAALFPMDPISTPPDAASTSGRMHGVSALIGIPAETLAVLLLSLALRTQPPWAKLPLLPLAVVIWLSLATLIAGMTVAMQQQGMAGPGIIGWANRMFMAAYGVWLVLVAWPMLRAAPR